MNADNVVKNVAKGLALGVLWPSAAVYVVGKRASKWMSELSHQSLDVAMDWSMAASDGVGEATHAIGMRWLKQPAVTKKANVARSVGAASADDPNVTGRRGWKLFGSDETKKEKDDQGKEAEKAPEPAPGNVPMKDKKERNLYTIAGAIAGIAGAVGYAYFAIGVVTIWTVANGAGLGMLAGELYVRVKELGGPRPAMRKLLDKVVASKPAVMHFLLNFLTLAFTIQLNISIMKPIVMSTVPLWTKLLAFPFATAVSISVVFMARLITVFIVRVFTTPSPSVSIMS